MRKHGAKIIEIMKIILYDFFRLYILYLNMYHKFQNVGSDQLMAKNIEEIHRVIIEAILSSYVLEKKKYIIKVKCSVFGEMAILALWLLKYVLNNF